MPWILWFEFKHENLPEFLAGFADAYFCFAAGFDGAFYAHPQSATSREEFFADFPVRDSLAAGVAGGAWEADSKQEGDPHGAAPESGDENGRVRTSGFIVQGWPAGVKGNLKRWPADSRGFNPRTRTDHRTEAGGAGRFDPAHVRLSLPRGLASTGIKRPRRVPYGP